MTQKQKKMLIRILVTFVLFAALLAGEYAGLLENIEGTWVLFVIYLVPYLVIGYDIIYKAARNISHGQVFDENFLMMVAIFGAFGVGEYSEGVAVMLFYQVGELFQSYAVGKSRQSISEMMDICPEYANIERDGTLVRADPDDVEVGSVIVVKPGERIPLDGVVIDGESLIDTAALTGESVPRKALAGDEVISGCVNGSGTLKVRTTKEFDDSTVSKILELVENASSKKAQVENFITRFAKYYTPIVTIGAVILAVLPPLILRGGWGEWIQRACIFLVISCPCALVISVPLGFFGGIGAASRIGVLVKGSNYLEAVAEVETVVFDKTGTLTKGEFQVTELLPAEAAAPQPCGMAQEADAPQPHGKAQEADAPQPCGMAQGCSGEELLELAALGEGYSNHPIALSIREAYGVGMAAGLPAGMERVSEAQEPAGRGMERVTEAQELAGRGMVAGLPAGMERVSEAQEPAGRGMERVTEAQEPAGRGMERVTEAQELAGRGIQVRIDGRKVLIGNEKLMRENQIAYIPCKSAGTVVYVAREDTFLGAIVISDTVKEGAAEAIRSMKQVGVRKCVMLTGDRKRAAEAVAAELGIDEVHAELLPADKVAKVEELLEGAEGKQKLAFVGDGINDAPVLSRADVGIAMGSMGSDAAIEAADVVLMDDDVRKIAAVVRIARKTLAIVKQNIVFALGVKAAVLMLGAFGVANMWEAVFADVGVSVIAILNSMRALKAN